MFTGRRRRDEIGLDERFGDARERNAFHRERQHRHQAGERLHMRVVEAVSICGYPPLLEMPKRGILTVNVLVREKWR